MSVIKMTVATDYDQAHTELKFFFNNQNDYRNQKIIHEGSHHMTRLRIDTDDPNGYIKEKPSGCKDCVVWHKNNEELYIIVAVFY